VQGLLDKLAHPARIVVVSSGTHDPSKHTGMPDPRYTSAADLAQPRADQPADHGRRRYTTSKLCNVLTAYELARRLADERPGGAITVNAFDPGLMPGTGLARDYRGVRAFAWKYVLPALTAVPGLNVHTPGRSAAALARLVLDPGLRRTTGRYFSGGRDVRSSRDSYDRDKARDLWDTSVELTRV
jgi:NAD(P)-dependent dehydrogenase (short-subunit alcohol dehydrogenase family)